MRTRTLLISAVCAISLAVLSAGHAGSAATRLGFTAHVDNPWYTQDNHGNVWYFGESTAELDRHGRATSTKGSWRAGVHGAKPGIFMFARPRVGQSARQEFYAGQAEDHFQVLSVRAAVKVPYLSSRHALLTKEWTPLEPGLLYVRGIGTVLEQTVKGGDERNALVALRRAG